ncbi:uncharacterized protein LOC135107982 isoform X2 [Scylla paramamosain]|uniref:uncharacterized protein LOC135107982 isoform X2 n=1 Tax=Scylla paramamosain TaxID=85552 RepID=UPI00308373F0
MTGRREMTPLFRLLLAALSLRGCCGLHIVDLVVPEVVLNGSRSSVVLDCVYRYERYEQAGLVVKWFWNHEPEAVYQWIPGKKPVALGLLKGRVNLDYHATKDKYGRHRAMEVLRPTTDLTGYFTCRVSSFHDEKFTSKKMIVYAPATTMNLTYSRPAPGQVNISCEAHGIYPEPCLTLSRTSTHHARTSVPADVEIVEGEEGFSVFLEAKVEDASLHHETLFECVLHIPETEYRIQREIIYMPGGATGLDGAPTLLLVLSLLLPRLLSAAAARPPPIS